MSTELPNGWRVVIDHDEEYNANPGENVAWGDKEDAEYVALFEAGRMHAYGVMIQRPCNDCENWTVVESLWGVDIELETPGYSEQYTGEYLKISEIPHEYLREVVTSLLDNMQW